MNIRLLTKDDIPTLNEFFSAMGGESRAFFNRHDGNRKMVLDYLDNQPKEMIYWIAEIDNVMAGMLFLWDLDTSIPWLGIAVREEMRGKHIGRELIAYAQDYARENGMGGIQLTTHVANLRGQTLYEAMGFRKLGFYGSTGEFYYLYRFERKV